MIVLDTNVVSEAMKPEPDPAVRDWLDEQVAETLYISSVTVAELLFGIGAMPEGRRCAPGRWRSQPALPAISGCLQPCVAFYLWLNSTSS